MVGRIVERYHGQLRIDSTGSVFTAEAILYLGEAKSDAGLPDPVAGQILFSVEVVDLHGRTP